MDLQIIQATIVITYQVTVTILDRTLITEINGVVTLVDLLEQLYSEVTLTEIVLLELLVLTPTQFQVLLIIQEHTHIM